MNQFVNILKIYNSKAKRIDDLKFGQYFEREKNKGLYLRLDVCNSDIYNRQSYRCYNFNSNKLEYIYMDEVVLEVTDIKIEYNANFR